MTPPELAVTGAAVGLGRALREAGLAVGVDEELVFCRGLAEIDVRHRGQVYWTARSVFLRGPGEVPGFDRVFARFWAGLPLEGRAAVAEHGEGDPRTEAAAHGGESLPQFRSEGRSAHLVGGDRARATSSLEIAASARDDSGRGERRGVLAAYSPDEILSERETLGCERDELAAIRRLAEELRVSAPERRSRRRRPSGRGRLDLRETVRLALGTDGEAVRLAFASSSRVPRRLVLVCDVSGSMERYSRALLASLRGAVGAGIEAEAFVFATRLTRLTGALGGRDVARALEEARAAVPDWAGGTRIGQVLAEFNRTHGRRGLARGAIVVIVSDGWDRGDPELLASELARLRLHCRRLVWLNPRPAELDGQPLAVGMRAALPYLDDFVPGHDPRAVVRFASVVGGLVAGRPPRRQRVLGLGRR